MLVGWLTAASGKGLEVGSALAELGEGMGWLTGALGAGLVVGSVLTVLVLGWPVAAAFKVGLVMGSVLTLLVVGWLTAASGAVVGTGLLAGSVVIALAALGPG
jgi:hypothetical protein